MAVVKRNERQHYLNVGDGKASLWAPVGEGFTKFKEEKNATVFKRRFFHESDERTLNEGYAQTIVYDFELYNGNLACEKLREICDSELCGVDSEVEILTVDFFGVTDVPDTYPAAVRRYSVVPDECGDGTDSLRYTGILCASGEILRGVFVQSTDTFVPEEKGEN